MTERFKHDTANFIVVMLALVAIGVCTLWAIDRDKQRTHELALRGCAEVQTDAK